jgi:hypothetical protein
MKRIAVTLMALAMLGAGAGVATAGPGDQHNCAGTVVSGLAGPSFGPFVSSFAHVQQVDNFGLANCGRPERNNP